MTSMGGLNETLACIPGRMTVERKDNHSVKRLMISLAGARVICAAAVVVVVCLLLPVVGATTIRNGKATVRSLILLAPGWLTDLILILIIALVLLPLLFLTSCSLSLFLYHHHLTVASICFAPIDCAA